MASLAIRAFGFSTVQEACAELLSDWNGATVRHERLREAASSACVSAPFTGGLAALTGKRVFNQRPGCISTRRNHCNVGLLAAPQRAPGVRHGIQLGRRLENLFVLAQRAHAFADVFHGARSTTAKGAV